MLGSASTGICYTCCYKNSTTAAVPAVCRGCTGACPVGPQSSVRAASSWRWCGAAALLQACAIRVITRAAHSPQSSSYAGRAPWGLPPAAPPAKGTVGALNAPLSPATAPGLQRFGTSLSNSTIQAVREPRSIPRGFLACSSINSPTVQNNTTCRNY